MTTFTFGLFKNVQMQGAQGLGREAYFTYVERHRTKRNTADEYFVIPFGFFR
jgi:hypothetical protein